LLPNAGDTDQSAAYVRYMVSTFLVIGGVLVGLLVLLALIVSLSARPAAASRRSMAEASPAWTGQVGRPHPDAWSEPVPTSEMPAVR
jgi:hypothetical protein